jgi:hypothetical protein
MGSIKDIIDLAKDLESRAKDRKDIETLRSIISLTHEVQSHNAEVVERDIRIMEENQELKRQLAEANAEDIRFAAGIKFRNGKKTGGVWMAFCPQCDMPAIEYEHGTVSCSSGCGWFGAQVPNGLDSVIRDLGGHDA